MSLEVLLPESTTVFVYPKFRHSFSQSGSDKIGFVRKILSKLVVMYWLLYCTQSTNCTNYQLKTSLENPKIIKPFERVYLPELFRKITTYLPEQFQQIATYLPELFRQITTSFKKICHVWYAWKALDLRIPNISLFFTVAK